MRMSYILLLWCVQQLNSWQDVCRPAMDDDSKQLVLPHEEEGCETVFKGEILCHVLRSYRCVS